MFSVLIFIIILGVLVIVHESGHFLAARFLGVRVFKFSVGFGKKIFSFKKNGTEYCLSALPLGGFVKMKGENPEERESSDGDEFYAQPWWGRALIAFNGPFFNLIFAFILFVAVYLTGRTYEDNFPVLQSVGESFSDYLRENDEIISINGNPVKGWIEMSQFFKDGELNKISIKRDGKTETFEHTFKTVDFYSENMVLLPAVIGDVLPGMPAYSAGLEENDTVLKVDGKPVKNWYEMRSAIVDSEKKKTVLSILRNGKTFSKVLIPAENPLDDTGKIIGITHVMPVKIIDRYSFGQSIKRGFNTTFAVLAGNYYGLFKLIQKPKAFRESIGSPLMLASMTKQTAKKGVDSVIFLAGSVSILLMVMNLLPIPVLDGGHIMYCFIEALSGKSVPVKLQLILQQVGLLLLTGLMLFAFFNDIMKLTERSLSQKKQTELFDN